MLWMKLNQKNKNKTIKMISLMENSVEAIEFLVFDVKINLHKNLENLLIKNQKYHLMKTIQARNLMLELEKNGNLSNLSKI
jgi:hypothetical protein